VRFELTEEQELIRRTARDFAERVLAPRARARDEEELFPEAELRQLAELGLLGVNVPAVLGGALERLTDVELRTRLGAGARARAEREYSWAAHCRALSETFT
jgi:alkylation response protein AidB-like acyl-CoA dehydrogenase